MPCSSSQTTSSHHHPFRGTWVPPATPSTSPNPGAVNSLPPGPGPPEPPERAGLPCAQRAQPPLGRVCSSWERTAGQAGVKLSQSTHSARQVVSFRPPAPSCQAGGEPTLSHPGPPLQHQGQQRSRVEEGGAKTPGRSSRWLVIISGHPLSRLCGPFGPAPSPPAQSAAP